MILRCDAYQLNEKNDSYDGIVNNIQQQYVDQHPNGKLG